MDASLSVTHLGLSLVAGSLTTLAPCVFPLLPIVIGGTANSNRWAPVVMGAGMVTAFVLIGLVLGALGAALGIGGDSIRAAGGWLLIALAVVMLVPAFQARFAAALTPLSNNADSLTQGINTQSPAGTFLLGALLGAVWAPCSGPLLASALTLVASEGGAGRGSLILGVFGLGAALPLIGVAYASRRGFERIKIKVLGYMDWMKTAFAMLIGLMGLAILTGFDKRLEALLTGLLPDWWLALTTSI